MNKTEQSNDMHLLSTNWPQQDEHNWRHKFSLRSNCIHLSDSIIALCSIRCGSKHLEQIPFWVCSPQSQTQCVLEKYCEIVLFFVAAIPVVTPATPRIKDLFDDEFHNWFLSKIFEAMSSESMYCDLRGKSANHWFASTPISNKHLKYYNEKDNKNYYVWTKIIQENL